MSYRELLPHPALRPYVDRFWLRTPERERAGAARILPDGCIDILVDVASGEARVVGTMTTATLYTAGLKKPGGGAFQTWRGRWFSTRSCRGADRSRGGR